MKLDHVLPLWPLRRARDQWEQFAVGFRRNAYEHLYESHARGDSSAESVGAGNYELIWKMALSLLKMAGLRSTHTLVDFGCGSGRLAVQVIPELNGGRYIGIDIAKTFLRRADKLHSTRRAAAPVSYSTMEADDAGLRPARCEPRHDLRVFGLHAHGARRHIPVPPRSPSHRSHLAAASCFRVCRSGCPPLTASFWTKQTSR